jgi:hypothetical protein
MLIIGGPPLSVDNLFQPWHELHLALQALMQFLEEV